jgi:hypothetical protein
MWIKSFRLTNYKSFDDSGEHALARHMNVIVGQNNVGKTALLQAIAQRLVAQPHRNSAQRRGEARNPFSSIELDFVTTGQEISDAMMASGPGAVILPASWKDTPLKFLELPEVTLSAVFQATPGGNWARGRFPSNNIATSDGNYVRINFAADAPRKTFNTHHVD